MADNKPKVQAVKKTNEKKTPVKKTTLNKLTKEFKRTKKTKKGMLALIPVLLIFIVIIMIALCKTTYNFWYLDEAEIEYGKEAVKLDSRTGSFYKQVEMVEKEEILSEKDWVGWNISWEGYERANFDNIFKTIDLYLILTEVDSKPELEIVEPEVSGDEYPDYTGNFYLSIINPTIESLNSLLRKDFKATSYNDAGKGNMLVEADTPYNSDKVYGIYNGQLFERDWQSGKNFEREHVWPNARLGMQRVTSTGKNQASDLHNLRAIGGVYTGTINQRRSDRYFKDCENQGAHVPHVNGKEAFCLGQGSIVLTYEDGKFKDGKQGEHRGDVARIFMYMLIMYKDILKVGTEEELINYTAYGAKETYMPLAGGLEMLLSWHLSDPVDSFERHRNEIISQFQGNRNPFIDKPEWAEAVF